MYLTDATFAGGSTFYYRPRDGRPVAAASATSSARFPAAASIARGEYQTVSLAGSDNFNAAYGVTRRTSCSKTAPLPMASQTCAKQCTGRSQVKAGSQTAARLQSCSIGTERATL